MTEGILFLDRDWRIVYANPAARRLARIEPQHINGPSHWEIYPATAGTPQETIYRTSMEQRVSLEHELYYQPFQLWVSLRTFPIPSGIAVQFHDISRLKGAEVARDESARQLLEVFEVTNDAIFTLDRHYTFTFLNRRALELSTPSGNPIGKNYLDRLP